MYILIVGAIGDGGIGIQRLHLAKVVVVIHGYFYWAVGRWKVERAVGRWNVERAVGAVQFPNTAAISCCGKVVGRWNVEKAGIGATRISEGGGNFWRW